MTVEYSTISGSATGGYSLDDPEVDFIHSNGSLVFRHGEAAKSIIIPVNPKSVVNGSSTSAGGEGGGAATAAAAVTKNFIIALKNPSIGAKIGASSAAVVHLATKVTVALFCLSYLHSVSLYLFIY